MSKRRVKKLQVKKMNWGVYVAACVLIASSLMIALIIGLAEFGFVNIRAIDLIIETESAAKIYDGKPLIGGAYKLVHGNLEPGHTLKVTSQSSQTEVGNSLNVMKFVIYDSSGSDVTDQYNIKQQYGTLTVSLREVSLRTHSAAKVYDGSPLSDPEIDVIGARKLALNHTAYIVSPLEITDVGEIANNGKIKVFDENGLDVTSQYVLNVEEGTLRVDPKQITIKTGAASKVYDGTPLVNGNWEIISGSLLPGHKIEAHCIGSITEAGEAENEASVNIFDSYGIDVTKQYRINMNLGKLTVTRRNLYITTSSSEKIYDGTALKSEAWEITSGTLEPGDKIEVVGCTEIYEVGAIRNGLTFVVRDALGRDVTSRYEINQSMGWLTLKPRKISISTGSAQKKYDGTPLYSDQWKLISGSLCADHSLTVTGVRRTAIGTSENVLISYAIYQDRNGVRTDVTDCYQITFSYGKITVKP